MNAPPSIAPTLSGRARLWAIDGLLLGAFMTSACGFATLLEHPRSPLPHVLVNADLRRGLMGLAMSGTAVAIIYSPLGRRTGPLLNPAMVLTLFRLRKLSMLDAVGFMLMQFALGPIGVFVAWLLLRPWVAESPVFYAATQPGPFGRMAAWWAEFAIALLMVVVVMAVNGKPRWTRFGGAAAAFLVAVFITFEAPISGMALNPARSFASAVFAQIWSGLWIYLTAPVAGMLAGAELVRACRRDDESLCAKLAHDERCAIRCQCLNRDSVHQSRDVRPSLSRIESDRASVPNTAV
ncbi:MAG: aquaporin [Tepidisphaeraceae bacterium]